MLTTTTEHIYQLIITSVHQTRCCHCVSEHINGSDL